MNRLIARLTKMGVSVWGSRVLRVRGRRSGQWRSNPVNVLTLDGARYLVAPRGVTDWVRNLRESGTGELVVGGRVEAFAAAELAHSLPDGSKAEGSATGTAAAQDGRQSDDETITVLRAYLRRWEWEVGQFFDGVGPDSTDDELRAIAAKHPIFRIATTTS
ncbi:MAG: nitroreductase family deazaflavin-dependent oxidoreductase [Geodermatophilaceae bacterium]|nr:nitroreductase family deazaflavin-dependent oxidoreductase [Geodermatophilaceae bacterium]